MQKRTFVEKVRDTLRNVRASTGDLSSLWDTPSWDDKTDSWKFCTVRLPSAFRSPLLQLLPR